MLRLFCVVTILVTYDVFLPKECIFTKAENKVEVAGPPATGHGDMGPGGKLTKIAEGRRDYAPSYMTPIRPWKKALGAEVTKITDIVAHPSGIELTKIHGSPFGTRQALKTSRNQLEINIADAQSPSRDIELTKIEGFD